MQSRPAVSRPNIPIKQGTLSKYGYHNITTEPTKIRHHALGKAVAIDGAGTVHKRLVAGYTLNKNKRPKTAAVFKKDANWVSSYYMR